MPICFHPAEAIAAVILAETLTFGVRISLWERICLGRRWEEVVTEFVAIRIKIGGQDGTAITASPEYKDCKRAASEHGVAVRHVHESAAALFFRKESR